MTVTDAAAPLARPAVAHIPAYVPGRRSTRAEVARLASNENPFDPLPSVREAVVAATTRLNRYPDPAAMALRGRLADHHGVGVDHIALGPGSSAVIQQAIAAYCEPGDEVVHAWRSFEAYPLLTRLAGATPVGVPLSAGGAHDLDAMAQAITARTRLVLLCTPNNPTGVALTPAEVEEFLERVPPSVLVVLDEAYVEYDHGAPDGIALMRRHPNLCSVRTFSKAHGLAALRLGYAVARPEVADALRRTMLTFAVTDLAQVAALASLDAAEELRQRVDTVVAERDRMLRVVRAMGLPTTHSRGNFVWLPCDERRSAELVAAFDAADVLVREYAGDGVRITVGERAENDRALAVLSVHAPMERRSA